MSQNDGLLAQHLHHQDLTNANKHFWHRLRWRFVRKQIRKLMSAGSVLDLGAGNGVAGNFLKVDEAYRYYFVEPIESLRAKLRQDFGQDRDWTDEPRYPGAKIVIMLDVLEHIEDDLGFLRELEKKMDSGTDLLILVPARQELWSPWDEKLGHFRRYTTEKLKALAAETGFRFVETRYLFPQFFILGLIRKKLGGGKREGADLPVVPSLVNQAVYLVSVMISWVLPRPPVGSSAFLHLKKSDG